MGVDWILVDIDSKMRNPRYIPLGKRAEWSNDLYKILLFLDTADKPLFIRDEESLYHSIINNKSAYLDDNEYTDVEALHHVAEKLSHALTTTLHRITVIKELKDTCPDDWQERLRKIDKGG
jgi:hypothetical protein